MYIVALAVLHNIAVELNKPPFVDDDVQHPPHSRIVPVIHQNVLRGAAARSIFIEENF